MRHPLRLLLYIEWILFAVVMAMEVLLPTHSKAMLDRPVWLNIGIVVWLAILGLCLPAPTGKLSTKIIYTFAEIIPIAIAAQGGMRPVSLLCVIVSIRSFAIFDRQHRLWITGGIFALLLMTMNLRAAPPIHHSQQFRPPHDEFRWGFLLSFGGILFCLQLLVDRIFAEQQAKEELAIANQRIRDYALRAEEVATLQERNRIAREIHDSLGHSLTALNLHLEMALKLAQIQPERSSEVLKEAKRLGSIALGDVRQSVSTLRAHPLQVQNLGAAIEKLADEFQLSNQIKPRCSLDIPPNLSPDIATAIYRIVQEALTNISKYADATEIELAIQSRPTAIELSIVDNGHGFTPTHNTTGFGIQGMRERVISLQGKFDIISTPECGCQIVAIIPIGSS